MKEKNTIAYLLLGSNIGDRISFLEEAVRALERLFTIEGRSSIYETASWGDRSQASYLNLILAIGTTISPRALHAVTRTIEKKMGRTEKGNFQPRKIDIDILFYGDSIVDDENLTIPHPRIQLRRFVLVPLYELAPGHVHPVSGKNVGELLEECEDTLEVRKMEDDEQ